jgi:ATP-dependent Lon protease
MPRIDPMRDFRDAKAMAQTLRDALKQKSVSLTQSESPELIAKILGFRDWNVLSATIQSEPEDRTPIMIPTGEDRPAVPLPAGADLPVVPLRDIVMFPSMIVPVVIGREKTSRALDCAMAADKRIVAVTQRQAGDNDPTQEALYGVGVIASVINLISLADMAKGIEADRVARGTVQKVSNHILNINLYMVNVQTGHLEFAKSVDIRGNTDESWRRGLNYMLRHYIFGEP